MQTTTSFQARLAATGLRHRVIVEYLVLAAITALAGVLRFYRLGAWGFWVDEVHTIRYAFDLLSHDPLYFLLRHPISTKLIALLFLAVPADEWSARLIPALIGTLSIPLIYLPSRRLFGTPVALIAGLLLAVSPWHIYWSQNARFYTALLLTYTLALLYLFIGLREGRRWALVLGAVLLLVAVRERMMALFAVPVLLGYVALSWLSFERERRRGLLVPLLIALGAPLLYVAYDVGHAWLLGHQPAVIAFFQLYVGVTTPGPSMLGLIGRWLGLPLVTLALSGALYIVVGRRTPEHLLLVLSVGVPIAALVVLSAFSRTQDRYVFVTLSFWTLLAALAVWELFRQLHGDARVLILGLCALLLLDPVSQLRSYYGPQNGFRPDWRGAFAVVAERRGPDAIVYSSSAVLGEYYLGPPVRNDHRVTPEQIEAAGREIWLVLDTELAWPSASRERWLEAHTEIVDEHVVRSPGRETRLRVHLYRPVDSPPPNGYNDRDTLRTP